MSTIDTLNDAAFKIKHELVAAQKAFVKLPNATNWQVCLRVMFTHQQLEYAIRSNLVDKDKLAFDLTVNPRGEWENVICRATIDMGIKQAIQEFAVF
jgi:hypothetical protein